MKKKLLKMGIVVLITSLLCGCSQRVLDFTLISTKNVDMSKASSFTRGNARVKGVDMVHLIIIFPTGSVSIKEAVDKAIEQTPGCVALLDGVIYSKFWWIPYIYGQSSATVEGTPLIDSSVALNTDEIPLFSKIEIGKSGKVEQVEAITPDQFYAMKDKMSKNSRGDKFIHSDLLK